MGVGMAMGISQDVGLRSGDGIGLGMGFCIGSGVGFCIGVGIGWGIGHGVGLGTGFFAADASAIWQQPLTVHTALQWCGKGGMGIGIGGRHGG